MVIVLYHTHLELSFFCSKWEIKPKKNQKEYFIDFTKTKIYFISLKIWQIDFRFHSAFPSFFCFSATLCEKIFKCQKWESEVDHKWLFSKLRTTFHSTIWWRKSSDIVTFNQQRIFSYHVSNRDIFYNLSIF